ncbi:MAG: class I SAM-dependent methyltransferase [Planctomycetia bacterium]|nr:class I SAM-dependent methyltransferase [Planctomycetia bacterium]
MKRWKTYLLLFALHSGLVLALLTMRRGFRNALKEPIMADPGDSKRWEYLCGSSELPRYAVIVGYVRRARPHATVLDVGAGNGVLAEELRHDVRLLRGIERDAASVQKANERKIDIADFLAADAEMYTTNDKFDVIIFNETLYYMNNPIQILDRYAAFLERDGILIVSTYIARKLLTLPIEIARHFDVVEQATVLNARGLGWIIQVVRKRPDAVAPASTVDYSTIPERSRFVRARRDGPP